MWGRTYGNLILGWMNIPLPPISMFTRIFFLGFGPWPHGKNPPDPLPPSPPNTPPLSPLPPSPPPPARLSLFGSLAAELHRCGWPSRARRCQAGKVYRKGGEVEVRGRLSAVFFFLDKKMTLLASSVLFFSQKMTLLASSSFVFSQKMTLLASSSFVFSQKMTRLASSSFFSSFSFFLRE